MTVDIINMQSGGKKGGPSLSATALFFSGIDNVALTPQTVVPTGGVAPYSFASVNFPAGVTVNAGTGVVSGTPANFGNTTNASVTVTDASLHTFSVPIFFNVFQGTFADSFARADQPFVVGDLWGYSPLAQSTAVGPNIAASLNVVSSALQVSICSSNGQNQMLLYPIVVDWPQCFTNHAQYAQLAISADNSGGANFAFNGPAVMFNVNRSTGYYIQTNNTGAGNALLKYIIGSSNGGAESNLDTNSNTGYTFALGDILRIEAYPNTPVANQTTIKHYRNGVLQNTVIDSTNHYNNGCYGIMDLFVSAGVTQSIQNFQGGILS